MPTELPSSAAGSASIPRVEVIPRRRVSPIWLLPMIAFMIGAWLIYKTLVEAGADVQIVFQSVAGMHVGKTKVMYQGVVIGRVTDIHLDADLHSVRVSVQVKPEAEPLLMASTQFWLVRPKVSLSGISGLETLVSGVYIALSPGVGEPSRAFVALPEAPTIDPYAVGLQIQLKADTLGSIDKGSKVYFKQLPVGEVQGYALMDDHTGVRIDVFIEQSFRHLVQKKTRFWNTSGISVEGSLAGVKVKAESLSAVIGGGIAFFSPLSNERGDVAENGDQFHLFNNFSEAKIQPPGLLVTLKAKDRGSIDRGTAIFYKNIAVGSVQDYRLSNDQSMVEFDLYIKSEYGHLVRQNTRFWHASGITLKGKLTEFKVQVGSLSSMLHGGIAFMTPDQVKPRVKNSAVFNLYPDYDAASERGTWLQKRGLTVRLRAKALGAIGFGSPVYYKRIKVGEVRGWHLPKNDRHVSIELHIERDYQHLVKRHSRFWHASGLSVSGGWTGVKVKAESLAAVLEGGIAFFSPNMAQKKGATPGQVFPLYADYDAATLNGRLLQLGQTSGLKLRIIADDLGSIDTHSPILYQKLPIGEVTHFNLHDDNRRVVLHVRIQQRYAHLVRQKSRFWNASGISASANLTGIKIKAESIKSLISGGIGLYTPIQGGRQSTSEDHFQLYANQVSAKHDGLSITLLYARNQNLQIGAALRYQGIDIGRITDIRLHQRSGIEVQAMLFEEAKHFAVEGSQFWVVSAKVGLAKTENLSSLILGNHIAAYAGKGRPKTYFKGLKHAPMVNAQQGLNIVLTTPQLGSIKVHDPVYYRQIKVGQVLGFSLAPSADHVLIQVNIEPAYERLVRRHSQFWNMSGIEVDFSLWEGINIKTSTLEAILEGGIGFATPNNAQMGPPAQVGDEYPIHHEFDGQWLRWVPKIPLKGG